MTSSPQELSILVVDDSAIYRNIVSTCLEDIPCARPIGVARDGSEALERVRELEPDLVLLDVEMPVMDGLETLQRMKDMHPEIGIIMVSGHDKSASIETMTALRLGAFDFIVKPRVASGQDGHSALRAPLQEALGAYGRRLAGESGDTEAIAGAGAERATAGVDVVALCASTGGPGALGALITQLPADLAVPVLVAQRMPAGFTESLAESLDRDSALAVREAADGEVLRAGAVYVAPGGFDLRVVRSSSGPRAELTPAAEGSTSSPSADVLFSSLPEVFGRRILAGVLTGVGDDGLAGITAIRSSGGYSLAQDSATSTVFDQPHSIISAGEADEVLPLGEFAHRIAKLSTH